MKLKSLFLAMLAAVATFATAQVENGKIYRIVSAKYGTVVSEAPIAHTLSCAAESDNTGYNEMWKFIATDNGKFLIQNVYTQRYIKNESGRNVVWRTANEHTGFAITENKTLKGYYNIDINAGSNWGMHCDGSSNIVPWSYGPEDGEVTGTEWTFREVSITNEEAAKAYTEYQEYNNLMTNIPQIVATVGGLYEDKAGTVLKAEYASMSDEQLIAAMEGVPAELQQAVLKSKNDSWDSVTREKEFRVYSYKPYSDPEKWHNVLYTRLYSPIDNPTGICSKSNRDFAYIFVDAIPEGSSITLREVAGTAYFGNDTRLSEGLNIVPCNTTNSYLYIRYICDTDTAGKKLADYPAVKIRIEGGYVNGFWSKERGHTNDDWAYMQEHMFKNEAAIQAKGDYTLLSFRKKEFLNHDACPKKIEELVGLWDFWNKTQQKYMALDKYYDWFNNLQLAMSDDTGFMDAGNHRTHYNNNTLGTICNYDLLVADAGSTWGPNHEIGHNNQYAFEIVGTSEVSNNALANIVTFEQGTHTSRGNNMENQIADFENKVPYVLRGESKYGSKLFSMTRMYFQLFLYAHAAGKCPDFYPRLFERLRYDRMVGWSVGSSDELDENGFYKNSVNALHDQLKFAEVCCEILQMDLSEFFEAWGFFIPFKNGFVGDYGHHWVYLLEEDVKASKARMQKYEKKGGHLMFLEDRVRPSKRLDGTGYRQSYADWDGERVGDVGDYGQWEDYIDESVKAEGYYYAISKNTVLIKEDANAKGALGFKLYNADTNELLSFTNRKSMNIPLSAKDANLKVVAAQADGTDYVVPHASEGPKEMQMEAFTAAYNSASNLSSKKAKDNTEIGFYYPEYFADFDVLFKEAETVKENPDNHLDRLAQLAMELEDARNSIINNPNAQIKIREAAAFQMRNAGNRKYYAAGEYPVANGVEIKDNESTPDKAKWFVEYAGTPGVYHLKCKSGYYITGLSANSDAYTDSKDKADAVEFNVSYTASGNTTFLMRDNNSVAVGINGGKVVGTSPETTNGQWRVRVIADEDESAAHYANEFNALMKEANLKVTEILNLDSLGTMNIFNSNIIVLDRNLETSALNLHYAHEGYKAEAPTAHQNAVEQLRKFIAELDGKYINAAPIATKGDRIVWYYIISNNSNKFVSIYNDTRPTLKNSLAMSTEADDYALWSFASTGKAGEYKLYNAGNEGFAYREGTKKNIFTSATAEPLPITVTYDAENNGLVMSIGENYIYESSTAPTLASSISSWRIEIADIEFNKEIADIITTIENVVEHVESDGSNGLYDLQGRRVEAAEKGIYIKDGKKVLVK